MKPEPGPKRKSADRLSAAGPPIRASGRAAEGAAKFRSNVPLRPPAAPSRIPPEELPPIHREAVAQALAAAAQGAGVELRVEALRDSVRIVPAVLDAIQQSGFTPDEIQRMLSRMANAVGSDEGRSQLQQVPEMPDLRIYKTLLGKPTTVHFFRFVLAVLPEQSVVVVVDCFYRRERAI